MKKLTKALFISFVLAFAITLIPVTTTQVEAKQKAKVTYTLKKGTLTIKGKGKMPKSMTFKNNKKIKKVVIKKGVTSISNEAFYQCKNLKKVTIPKTVKEIGYYSFAGTKLTEVTIPKSVKKIGQQAFMNNKKLKKITLPGDFKLKVQAGDEGSLGLTFHTKVESVKFNTNIALGNIACFNTNNLYASASDPNYKSINGVLYSKDGKDIVRVPRLRTELVIENGCENFNLMSIFYASEDEYCENLKKVTIPASLKNVNNKKYRDPIIYYYQNWNKPTQYKKTSTSGYTHLIYNVECINNSKLLDQQSLDILQIITNNYFDLTKWEKISVYPYELNN